MRTCRGALEVAPALIQLRRCSAWPGTFDEPSIPSKDHTLKVVFYVSSFLYPENGSEVGDHERRLYLTKPRKNEKNLNTSTGSAARRYCTALRGNLHRLICSEPGVSDRAPVPRGISTGMRYVCAVGKVCHSEDCKAQALGLISVLLNVARLNDRIVLRVHVGPPHLTPVTAKAVVDVVRRPSVERVLGARRLG